MNSDLPPVRKKLERAAKHAQDFMDLYFPWHWSNPPPYGPVGGLDPHPTKPNISKGCWRVELITPPPLDDLAVLTGELLYQLRSVLEHLAYAIAGRDSHPKAPPKGTGFPIFLKSNDYDREGVPKLAGMSTTVQALIKECQPFDPSWNDDPRKHPLWLLHELSDTDRHQSPHIAVSLAKTRIEAEPPRNGRMLEFTTYDGPFKDGAKIARGAVLWTGTMDAEVKVNLALAPHIAFTEEGPTASKPYAGLGVLQALSDVHWYVVQRVFVERLGPYLLGERFYADLPPGNIRPPWVVVE